MADQEKETIKRNGWGGKFRKGLLVGKKHAFALFRVSIILPGEHSISLRKPRAFQMPMGVADVERGVAGKLPFGWVSLGDVAINFS